MTSQTLTEIRKAAEKDYPALVGIWDRSVRATHDFLHKDDYLQIKKDLASLYFPNVELYIITADSNYAGFIGLSGDMIEMLFIDDTYRRLGLGHKLMEFAISKGISKVDVNEQNKQAVLFYQSIGFKVISRDSSDSAGLPYPILHMSL